MKRIRMIFETYYKDMLKVANNVLKNHYDAEDVVQKTFIKLIRYRGQIEEMELEQLKAFLFVVTKNTAINELKRKDRMAVDIDSLPEISDDVSDILDTILTRELYLLATEEIKNLSEPDKTILMLRLYFEMDYKTIADIVGLSEANLRKRYERTKKSIINVLKRKGKN